MKENRSINVFSSLGLTTITILILITSVFIVAYVAIETIESRNSTNTELNLQNLSNAITHVLNNNTDLSEKDSYLPDDEFAIVQEYVKENEEQMKDYNPVSVTEEYSIYIDRETRALFVQNNQGMTRRLTWRTIDCNDYSQYDTFIAKNDKTYCIGKNIIKEYYLGEEVSSFEVPFEKPQIVGYYNNGVLATDIDTANSMLLLCTPKQSIEISDSFSKLPVEIHINGLYYIDSNQALYMYNLSTNQTTFITNEVYDLFYSSGVNFKTKDGIFRINCFVSESGEECIKDVNGKVTDSKFEKWNN